jgi:hypothetical protein
MSEFDTTKGKMTADSLLGEIMYSAYSWNREREPHRTLTFWKAIYPKVDEMEARLIAEKAIEKAAS